MAARCLELRWFDVALEVFLKRGYPSKCISMEHGSRGAVRAEPEHAFQTQRRLLEQSVVSPPVTEQVLLKRSKPKSRPTTPPNITRVHADTLNLKVRPKPWRRVGALVSRDSSFQQGTSTGMPSAVFGICTQLFTVNFVLSPISTSVVKSTTPPFPARKVGLWRKVTP